MPTLSLLEINQSCAKGTQRKAQDLSRVASAPALPSPVLRCTAPLPGGCALVCLATAGSINQSILRERHRASALPLHHSTLRCHSHSQAMLRDDWRLRGLKSGAKVRTIHMQSIHDFFTPATLMSHCAQWTGEHFDFLHSPRPSQLLQSTGY